MKSLGSPCGLGAEALSAVHGDEIRVVEDVFVPRGSEVALLDTMTCTADREVAPGCFHPLGSLLRSPVDLVTDTLLCPAL